MIEEFQNLFQDQDENITKRCFLCNHEIKDIIVLHRCNHSFCSTCIKHYCYKAFYDLTYLPLSCPIRNCRCKIVISDILRIIQSKTHIKKLLRISLEKFIQNNRQCYIKCLTPNCTQIFEAKVQTVTCDHCLGRFCLKCRQVYHDGMSCK